MLGGQAVRERRRHEHSSHRRQDATLLKFADCRVVSPSAPFSIIGLEIRQ
jgi:hypothetical protein